MEMVLGTHSSMIESSLECDQLLVQDPALLKKYSVEIISEVLSRIMLIETIITSERIIP